MTLRKKMTSFGTKRKTSSNASFSADDWNYQKSLLARAGFFYSLISGVVRIPITAQCEFAALIQKLHLERLPYHR